MRNNFATITSVKYLIVRATHTTTVIFIRAVALFAITTLAYAGESSIAVIYPDIGEPYREVFDKIIEGIENKATAPLTKYAVRSDTDNAALGTSLQQKNIKVVIALGRQGMKTAATLDSNIRTITGGVLNVLQSEIRAAPVVSLSPDPALLFARLKTLMPSVKRVFVVYDPNTNDWLIKLANEAAQAQGLELTAYEAHDVRSAVRLYQEIFTKADSRRDALWLPQDPSTVEENSILPLVLQESWSQSIAVFSSNAAHVRRGALFSLYPDNVAMGKTLAGIAQNFLATGEFGKQGMMPLRDVQIAVNLRTAQHIGLNTSRQQKFDMIFPEQ